MNNNRFLQFFLVLFATLALMHGSAVGRESAPAVIAVTDLPHEARETLKLIRNDGPFPFAKDGAIFNNYEKLLPLKQRGYYREFTVRTPRLKNRGPRRIVAGGSRPAYNEYYYTDDHYATFRRIQQ